MKNGLTLATVALLGAPTAAVAHPGHGFTGTVESAVHWLASPDHAVSLVAVVLMVGLAGVRAVRRRAS